METKTEWEEVWKFGVLTGWRRVCGNDEGIWFEFRGNPDMVFSKLITLEDGEPQS